MSESTSLMDTHFMQRTDSEATDESPFGSVLATPVDEMLPPFENIHSRLFAQLDLQSQDAKKQIQTHDYFHGKDNSKSKSLLQVAPESLLQVEEDDDAGSKTPLVHQDEQVDEEIICPPMERSSALSVSVSDDDLELPPSPQLQPAFEATHTHDQDPDSDLTDSELHTFPAELGVGTEFSISSSDDALLAESLPMNSPTITHDLFPIERSAFRPPHDRTLSSTAVKDLDVENLDADADDEASETEAQRAEKVKKALDEITLFDTAVFFFDDAFFARVLSLSQTDLLNLVPQAVLFLPWYALVGGVILLSPQHLESVTFSAGYVSSPPPGIRRYAHWAECALAHVLLFLLVVAMTKNPAVGVLVAAQTAVAWWDFRYDERVPVGKDDRQSLWLVAKGLVREVNLRREGAGVFYACEEACGDDADDHDGDD